MGKVPYLDYNRVIGPYTVQRVSDMLGLSMQDLMTKVEQYNLRLYLDKSGRYILYDSAIKKLHYRLYQESRGKRILDGQVYG